MEVVEGQLTGNLCGKHYTPVFFKHNYNVPLASMMACQTG